MILSYTLISPNCVKHLRDSPIGNESTQQAFRKHKANRVRINHQRNMREFVRSQRQRYPEKIIDQKLIEETNDQTRLPFDIFKWHIDVLNDKHALEKEVSEKEETIRKQAAVIKSQNELINKFGVVHQTYYKKPKGRRKNQRHYNKFRCNSSYNASQAQNTHPSRSRSKSDNNQEIDSMDFWEWNGSQWINNNPNRFEKKTKEKNDVHWKSAYLISNLTKETNAEQYGNTSSKTLQNNDCSNFNNWDTLPTPDSAFASRVVNPSNVPMRSIDDNGLIDCSISFEEHEFRKHSRNGEDILPKAKRPRTSERN